MHDNDIVSKIEHLMAKYNVTAGVRDKVYELAERACWPIKYNKDPRYVSIALGAALIYYNMIDPCIMNDELNTNTKERITCYAAVKVADYMHAIIASPTSVEPLTRTASKLSSIEFAVLTAYTEMALKRFCDDHAMDRAILTAKAYEYIKEHCVE